MTGFEDIIIKDVDGEAIKTNTKKTVHVAFVMDHSGSMSSQKQLALDNYNEQLASLKRKSNESGIETYVTLVEFDNKIKTKYENKLISEIQSEKNYWTCGTTSLNDAIFNATSLLKKSMKDDTCKDKSALIIIMTDGYENSSVEFAGSKGKNLIKKEIEKLEKTGEWTFTFMGANIDVQDIAVNGYGMSVGNTMSFNANDNGYKMSGGSVKSGLNKYYNARTYGAKNIANFHDNNTTASNEGQKITSGTEEEGKK